MIGACVVLADLCDIYIFIDSLLLLLLFVVFTRIRKIFPTCTYFLDPSHVDSIEMERSERERERTQYNSVSLSSIFEKKYRVECIKYRVEYKKHRVV